MVDIVTPPRIIVLSRLHARGFRGGEPYVVISIRSPGDSALALRPDPLRRARMNLVFIDGAPEWGHEQPKAVLLTPDQAERIARFLARHSDVTIVINCGAGISRSAGVAIGIRSALGFDAGEFAEAPYDPNPHVRRLVHDAITQLRAKEITHPARRDLRDRRALPSRTR